MPENTTIDIDTATFKGSISANTGLFIDGKWVDPVIPETIDVINPATGKKIAAVSVGSSKDVDIAVKAAHKAYKTTWGLKCPGSQRGKLLTRLADLLERDRDQFAALEAINVGKSMITCARTVAISFAHALGKPFNIANGGDLSGSINCIRYFGGWADKVQGKTIQNNESKLAYTRREPYGVVGQIIPWNFPMLMLSWKVGPALATGNCIVLKPSEMTPLSALKFAELIVEAGFPPGVFNIVNGYVPPSALHPGITVGQAISEHMNISKVAFTGSTLVGRKVLEASAKSNLKVVTLELGGKSPSIIFDDCDLEKTVRSAMQAMYGNMGQSCVAGTRIFIQEGIYPQFIEKFTALVKGLGQATGDPFAPTTKHGPQVSQVQFDRIMGYIESGKESGATVHVGGERHGTEGYFIQPTIFTDCTPDMKIVREEIFGPVAAIMTFKTEEEVIDAANASEYGLAACVFSENISRAVRVAHAIESGSTFVNSAQNIDPAVPFGGYKASGIGREHGEYALETYTQVKAVHVSIASL
ncbi:Aldehyde dehydrogenase 5 [Mycena venus]|uniref:Aldehyde dehydrogenase 5 n=1 Tax=Mycena venus TaxID=2733690 RepID=A0A8H6X747_9AGAR|nr:Aldehyde dehydrogenase 5 [Mycena venus]